MLRPLEHEMHVYSTLGGLPAWVKSATGAWSNAPVRGTSCSTAGVHDLLATIGGVFEAAFGHAFGIERTFARLTAH